MFFQDQLLVIADDGKLVYSVAQLWWQVEEAACLLLMHRDAALDVIYIGCQSSLRT